MKKYVIPSFVLSLVMGVSLSVSAIPNPDVARNIWDRYNNTIDTCNGDPAFKCSGIMIRGVNQEQKLPHAWSMKPENKKKEAFSMAYLRRDQHFSSFPRGYDSGFIIYPHFMTPNWKNTYKVFCAFPLDAHTDGRAGHGCGVSDGDKSKQSDHCQKQGITTLNKWIKHFDKIMASGDKNFVRRQCAFDMTKNMSGRDFAISGKATQYLQLKEPKYYLRNNEIRVHSWNEKNAKALPIEAFFYLLDSKNGLKYAQKYQRDFYKQSGGEIVPIVGIKLPQSYQQEMYVEFYPKNQAIW